MSLNECMNGSLSSSFPSALHTVHTYFKHSYYKLTLVNTAHINTNLHTHGLHVSGVGTVDDVTRVVEPGMCLTYEVSFKIQFRSVHLRLF